MPPLLPPSAIDPAFWAAGQTVQPATANATASAAEATHPQWSTRANDKAKEAGQQFEALYLRQMLEASMPKDSEQLFGKDTSGTMWRSMFADSLATTLSKSGRIGIAQMVIKSQPDPPEVK